MCKKSSQKNSSRHLTTLSAVSIILLATLRSVRSDSDYEADRFYGSETETSDELFDPINLQENVEAPDYVLSQSQIMLDDVTKFGESAIEVRNTDRNKTIHSEYNVEQATVQGIIVTDDMLSNESKQIITNLSTLIPTKIPDYLRQAYTDSFAATLQISLKDKTPKDSPDDEKDLISTMQSTLVNSGSNIPFTAKSGVSYQDDNNGDDNHLEVLPNRIKNHNTDDQINKNQDDNDYEDSPESIGYFNPASLLATTTEASVGAVIKNASIDSSLESWKATLTTASPATVFIEEQLTRQTTQEPTIFRSKQAKQMSIGGRKKLPPHEQLRNYIENEHIRKPLAVIVDPSPDSLQKIKTLWREVLGSNSAIKIVLVTLNASGNPTAYSFNNTRQFLAGLNSIKESPGGNAFTGVVHAAKLVPYDSAVFISTSYTPAYNDLDLIQGDVNSLLKKRIRLYLILCGDKSLSRAGGSLKNVGGFLGKIAIRSGGKVVHLLSKDGSQEFDENTLTLVSDAYHGAQEIEIPIDTTISSLHIKIDSSMRIATLSTPNGDINLKNLVKFKSRIIYENINNQLDAIVPLRNIDSTKLSLKIAPRSANEKYHVFVSAEQKSNFIGDDINHLDSYFLDGMSTHSSEILSSRLYSLDDTSAETHSDIRFSSDETKNRHDIETFSGVEISQMINAGNELNEQQGSLIHKDGTRIEMGIHSQMLLAPGMLGQLYFELTNTRSEGVYHTIQVTDEMGFLYKLAPQSVFLVPKKTVTITLSVLVPVSAPHGCKDRITFICHGSSHAFLSVDLKIIRGLDAQDNQPPSLTWRFGSRCENIRLDSVQCSEHQWTMDITTQDRETGILRLQTSPDGLIYRNYYTVGSNDPVKATYLASCCFPKVTVIAYDIAGNQITQNVDVRDLVLSEASIAAIVLGVLLVILLIIVTISLIVWCCGRHKVSQNLSTYRSHSRRMSAS